ncbi:radical S-adenosyl methionine domain-containing protein 1, mitochondrial-like isoform X2 [Dysidea avara]|uniref:radical S-adenosyl methionine domain-containing protein 1, mitochondrial-like isoform X2 n=1 Tax=Dysidea avara TaxID=196820 RepID=UPI0033219070
MNRGIKHLKRITRRIVKKSFSSDIKSKHGTVYVHWPYCAQLCSYCNFNKYVRDNVDHSLMRKALITELRTFIDMSGFHTVTSIFFGGGTPSLAAPSTIHAVINEVAKLCHLPTSAEINLEANPTSSGQSVLKDFKQAGVNRLSLGVQALNDKDLKLLNRDHNRSEALQALSLCKELFPGRLNIDIIFGRPRQTVDEWRTELEKVLEICDNHISLYQLTVERGTPLAKDVQNSRLKLPVEDHTADMYEHAVQRLSVAGLHRYEISNFARFGSESQHNYSYWRGDQYIGIGPGAHSRFSLRDQSQVIARVQAPVPDVWTKLVFSSGHGTRKSTMLTRKERFEEVFMTSLRTRNGLTNEIWYNLDMPNTIHTSLSELESVQELIKVFITDGYFYAGDYELLQRG